MPDLIERIVRVETQLSALQVDIAECRQLFTHSLQIQTMETDENLRRMQNLLDKIQASVDNVDKQTTKWKNIFWGIALTVSFFISVYNELSAFLSKLKP